MPELVTRDVFIELGGQDDNLGDSVLRAAYLRAVRGPGHRIHLLVGSATSDYLSGLRTSPTDTIYARRAGWAAASRAATGPVHVLNAGEINPPSGLYPEPGQATLIESAARAGGTVIAVGAGIRHPERPIEFNPALREASVLAWRDQVSRTAAGFGEVAPDWAFALGRETSQWAEPGSRPLLAVTLRFDRPWPDDAWCQAVRRLAEATSTQIVTVAQVARDSPRAVRLAERLGGEFLIAPSTRHDEVEAHIRAVYARSLAVVSDRAHGLIVAATEGAVPLGSAAAPEKLERMLAVVGLEATVGTYGDLGAVGELVETGTATLRPAIDRARTRLATLGDRIQSAIDATG